MTFREKQREADYFSGGIQSIGIFGVVFMLYIILFNPLLVGFMLTVIFLLIFLISFGILPFKRGFFMSTTDKVKELLGTDGKVTGMKLDALAKHLNVKLVHVPEHYSCRSLEIKEAEVTGAGTSKKI